MYFNRMPILCPLSCWASFLLECLTGMYPPGNQEIRSIKEVATVVNLNHQPLQPPAVNVVAL